MNIERPTSNVEWEKMKEQTYAWVEYRTAEQGTAEFRTLHFDIQYFLFDILRFKQIREIISQNERVRI